MPVKAVLAWGAWQNLAGPVLVAQAKTEGGEFLCYVSQYLAYRRHQRYGRESFHHAPLVGYAYVVVDSL